jgi:hypothetical protein
MWMRCMPGRCGWCAWRGKSRILWSEVDLGVAQGDTLSCVLFSLYASDLITAFEVACTGVALPGPPLQAPLSPPAA